MAIGVRYRIVGLLLAGTAINYLDRVNISVAAPSMMAATGLHKDRFGLIFSAFLLGYALMQIPAGIISDRKSAKTLLIVAFCALSLLTALTPLAAHWFVALIIIRLLLGVSEAAIFPAITALNVRWFPPAEFARAQMIGASGAPIGQMIAYPLTAWLVIQASWQAAFYASAVLGLIWLACWIWYGADSPGKHRGVTAAELAHVEVGVSKVMEPNRSMRLLITSAPVILLSASAACFSFVLWTFLFWLPTYLVEARGLTMARIGGLGVGIQACGAIGLLAAGLISDLILRHTGKAHLARPKFAGACSLVSMVFLLAAITAHSTPLALILLAAFYLFFMSSAVAYHATPAALLPAQAASIYGIVNTSANLGGVLGPAIVGLLVTQTTDWVRPLQIVASVGLMSSFLLLLVPVRRLDALPVSPPNASLRLSQWSDQ